MCYDQEKTQAPPDRVNRALENELHEKHRVYATDVAEAAQPMSDSDILAQLFQYHPPNANTLPKYAAINQAAKNFAEIVLSNCPRSADRSAAIRLIRDARMTANASVALNGLSL
jgi:hypothetical protein